MLGGDGDIESVGVADQLGLGFENVEQFGIDGRIGGPVEIGVMVTDSDLSKDAAGAQTRSFLNDRVNAAGSAAEGEQVEQRECWL